MPRKSEAERAMAETNSAKLITPSPSVSAPLIIRVSSGNVTGCFIFAKAAANSANVMTPLPLRSNSLNNSRTGFWFAKTCLFLLAKMTNTNSSNSTFLLPFESAMANRVWTCSPEGFSLSVTISAASSNFVKLPSESMSNLSNIAFRLFSCCTSRFDMVSSVECRICNAKKERETEGKEEGDVDV